MLTINSRIQIPTTEFQFSFARSGGPGGQNVNKVSSKAIMTWDVENSPSMPGDVRSRFKARYGKRINKEGVIQITSQRYRDQARNIEDCQSKLVELILAIAEPPVQRKPTAPTRGARQRRLNDKHVRSDVKQSRRKPRLSD
ncbi:MAG: alternative ribosome rescue aminoacyl-tRNA hydrolase ArfB [Planctomycetota bacterium]